MKKQLTASQLVKQQSIMSRATEDAQNNAKEETEPAIYVPPYKLPINEKNSKKVKYRKEQREKFRI